jgi:hypothetical protein
MFSSTCRSRLQGRHPDRTNEIAHERQKGPHSASSTAHALALLPVAELVEADLEGVPMEQRTAIQRMGGRVRVLRVHDEELLTDGEPDPQLPSWSVL